MVTIIEVKTRKEQREFLNFPLRLYRNDPYFVPPLYVDEKKIFRKDYIYNDTCETVYYLAQRDGKTVGRISGILQRAANEKNREKRVRFTRFDCLDDPEAAHALFGAVESWAKSIGMDTVCGPLGFSDLEREGLLIEGFDQIATFEEQYNYAYYPALIEGCGYEKEVDWLESKIYLPDEAQIAKLRSLADYVMKRYDLRWAQARSINELIDKYADGFFELLDKGYEHLYGTVPFTDGMKKMMLDNFRLVIDMDSVGVVVDKNDKVVCLGLGFASFGKVLQKSGGRLTPVTLARLLYTLRRPETMDLGLVAVDPAYLNRGISAVVCVKLVDIMQKKGVAYCETNLNLEDNFAIRNEWKRFREVQHKRRRAYVKKLT